jgi:hypothetical protein
MKLSRLGLALTILYAVWALFWISQIPSIGLKCTAGLIVDVCGGELIFLLTTFPAVVVASLLFIQIDLASFSQLIVYTVLSILLIYLIGFGFEKIIILFVKLIKRKK